MRLRKRRPRLNSERLKSLVEKAQKGCTDSMEEILELMEPTMKAIVKRSKKVFILNSTISDEDLMQELRFELCDAVSHYDCREFSEDDTVIIYNDSLGVVVKSSSEEIEVKLADESTQKFTKEEFEYIRVLQSTRPRATFSTFAQTFLYNRVKEIQKRFEAAKRGQFDKNGNIIHPKSLDYVYPNTSSEDGNLTLLHILVDEDQIVDEIAEGNVAIATLADELRKDQKMFHMRVLSLLLRGYTRKEISEKLNYTAQRVGTISREIGERLKAMLREC